MHLAIICNILGYQLRVEMKRLFIILIASSLVLFLTGCFKFIHKKLSGERFLYEKTVMQYTRYSAKILTKLAIDEINCELHSEHTGNFVLSMIEIVGVEKVKVYAKSDYAKLQVRKYERGRFSTSR